MSRLRSFARAWSDIDAASPRERRGVLVALVLLLLAACVDWGALLWSA